MGRLRDAGLDPVAAIPLEAPGAPANGPEYGGLSALGTLLEETVA